jgi:hypothetical protein
MMIWKPYTAAIIISDIVANCPEDVEVSDEYMRYAT